MQQFSMEKCSTVNSMLDFGIYLFVNAFESFFADSKVEHRILKFSNTVKLCLR